MSNPQEKRMFTSSKNKDYYLFFGLYIHKRIIQISLFCLLLIPVIFLVYEIGYTYYLKSLAPSERITYKITDLTLSEVKGEVILLDHQGTRIYEGEFMNGKCNGFGKVYLNDKIRYIGEFVNNQYEDTTGELYDEKGNLIYVGGFHESLYEGEGTEYYANGIPRKEGFFQRGKLHGQGIEYFEDGYMAYQGEYVRGDRHGQGIAYYENSNIRHFSGNFIYNTPIGDGSLYSITGREWFQGEVYGYQPDFVAYIGSNFAQIREHFLDPILVYTTSLHSALVIPKQDLLYISDQPYSEVLSQNEMSEEQEKKEIDETKITTVSVALIEDDYEIEDIAKEEAFIKEIVESGRGVHKIMEEEVDMMDMLVLAYLQTKGLETIYQPFIQVKMVDKELTILDIILPELTIYRDVFYYQDIATATMSVKQKSTLYYTIMKERKTAEVKE